jgi:hypothetical protein
MCFYRPPKAGHPAHCNRINALLTQKIAGLKGARFNLHNGKVIERAELGGR